MAYVHGMAGASPLDPSRHPLYARWVAMRQRCYNPQAERYDDYGGRGVYMAWEWAEFAVFAAYLMQLPHALETGYSVDRIDNDGAYAPGNVQWSTAAQQRRNQRRMPPLVRALLERENEWYTAQQERALDAIAIELWSHANCLGLVGLWFEVEDNSYHDGMTYHMSMTVRY